MLHDNHAVASNGAMQELEPNKYQYFHKFNKLNELSLWTSLWIL